MFRDQALKFWDELHKQPVKAVFQQEPFLMPADKGEQPIIIDVWDRQWLSKRFEKLKTEIADIFVDGKKCAEALIARSGLQGVYHEPIGPSTGDSHAPSIMSHGFPT